MAGLQLLRSTPVLWGTQLASSWLTDIWVHSSAIQEETSIFLFGDSYKFASKEANPAWLVFH